MFVSTLLYMKILLMDISLGRKLYLIVVIFFNYYQNALRLLRWTGRSGRGLGCVGWPGLNVFPSCSQASGVRSVASQNPKTWVEL